MKRFGAYAACLVFFAMSVVGCKEDKVIRNGLIQDLPVGYDENDSVSYGTEFKKTKMLGGIIERNVEMDIQVSESQVVRKKDEKQEMEAVDQDVKLYSWKSQPKTFVHLEEEVVADVKKNKKSR